MSVQQSVLRLMAAWQKTSSVNLNQRNAEITALSQTSDQIISHLIVVVLCLHLGEFRQIKLQGQLRQVMQQTQPYKELYGLWQSLCERSAQRFNLFALPHPDHLSSSLSDLFDLLLKTLLSSLYYPDSDQYAALPINSLGQVYEQTVALASYRNTRKSGGVYYTPAPLVNYVVRTTLERFAEPPLLLDPACGGGAFLVAAYQYLLERQQLHHSEISFSACKDLLNCIHGVDIDPTAVGVTRVSLWLVFLENIHIGDSLSPPMLLPALDRTIQCGNAVINDVALDPLALDWQTAFPQVQAGGFDLVLGNPPYLDAELMTTRFLPWRTYCAQHYQTATGNWDLFCVFIEKALQLCRSGGITSFVVPNKLLAAHYASAARQLLSRSRLWALRDYSQVTVFDAAVYAIVYIAEKDPPQTGPTQYEQMQTLERIGLAYPIHLAPDTRPWLVGIQTHGDLIRRLERWPKLGDWAKVMGAATVAEAYQLQGLIRNQAQPAVGDLRFVNSGTIDRYRLLWGQKSLRYLGQSYLCPVVAASDLGNLLPKRLQQSQQPKLIVAGMGLRLECILDGSGTVLAGKSTTLISLPICDPVSQLVLDPHYLLGLLNSRLLSFYLLTCFGGNRLQGGYLRIGPPQLRQLPVFAPNLAAGKTEYQQIIRLVQDRIQQEQAEKSYNSTANPASQQFEREIDQLVYALYQLEDSEIALVEDALDQL